MRILWLTWKDRKHPHAGGAEVVNEELAKRLAKDGHEVHFVVSRFPGSAAKEVRDGFGITRVGGRFSVYWKAYRHAKKNLVEAADVVIDEMNTIPFFARFYEKKKSIMFVHQLSREIWFYQMPFPVSLIGYILEPIYLWLLHRSKVITISESTKRDLMRFGFKEGNIHIISEGTKIPPVSYPDMIAKFDVPTILSFGAVRPMKRTDHIVKAFEIVKRSIPNARLIIAGGTRGKYGERVLAMAKNSAYAPDIEFLGGVASPKKIELMMKSHVIAVTSVKEGWGLVVTEANSQGTPAVVYNVDGLRDSVRDEETGMVTAQNNPQTLSYSIVRILQDKPRYDTLRKNAWEWSKEMTFDKSYRQFVELLEKSIKSKV